MPGYVCAKKRKVGVGGGGIVLTIRKKPRDPGLGRAMFQMLQHQRLF